MSGPEIFIAIAVFKSPHSGQTMKKINACAVYIGGGAQSGKSVRICDHGKPRSSRRHRGDVPESNAEWRYPCEFFKYLDFRVHGCSTFPARSTRVCTFADSVNSSGDSRPIMRAT